MARYAEIKSGSVVNVIEADATFATAYGLTACPDEVGPGWTYDGTTFTAPVIPPKVYTLAERYPMAAAECARRIVAVADATAQMNMASYQAAGLFSTAQTATYVSGLTWVAQMRGTWRGLAEADADLSADANWPACPADVIALAAQF